MRFRQLLNSDLVTRKLDRIPDRQAVRADKGVGKCAGSLADRSTMLADLGAPASGLGEPPTERIQRPGRHGAKVSEGRVEGGGPVLDLGILREATLPVPRPVEAPKHCEPD
jgi:hypothetical protein